jgi:anti-sigma regulatory factor (Ser/Thr protein kinase)
VATIKLSMPADGTAVTVAVTTARRFAAELPVRVADRLAIIVEELVENLVEHAVHPPDASIRLCIWVDAGWVRLKLIDQAAPFDPRSATMMPIPARGGGAGLALVRAWTQIDGYEREAGCNVLLLSMPLAG